ncbi:hypothetical protein BH09ACT12_BH09ACT12_28150 [soil metagenome]
MRREDRSGSDCAIEQALDVVGDTWSLLIVRDIAGGVTRFDALQRELSVSRKVLTERLGTLHDAGVIAKQAYSERPLRHDYVLTARGEGLLPVLLALQDWGTRHVLGDGSLTATAGAASAEARRVEALVGTRLPPLHLTAYDGEPVDPVAATHHLTAIFCFPGAYPPGMLGYPPGWSDIPGTAGCTLEARTYAAHHTELGTLGVAVHGVSTQRPDQLAAFAAHESLPYPMLSDQDGRLAAALRLPIFRAAGADRLKRATLLVDDERTIRYVQFPITDPAASVAELLSAISDL